MTESATYLLEAQDIVTGYGQKRVLNGVTVKIQPGECVSIIGHNGAGKSTLLKAIFGMIPLWDGSVTLDGDPLQSIDPQNMLSWGIAYVPQGNRVFEDLSVRENLEVGGMSLPSREFLNERIEHVLEFFPSLKSRLSQRARTLSGGEKQMLALSNALLLSPRLLLLDEPSLGLAPSLIEQAFERLEQLCSETDVALLLVEQKVRKALRISDRAYVLKNGRVSFSGPASDLSEAAKLREVYL